MVNRLPSWLFIGLAMIFMGMALLPIIRAVLGVDETIQLQFFTVVALLISGLMCGLTGMLLLVKRQPDLRNYLTENDDHKSSTKLHACGLLLYTGIPLANFLLCYFLWVKHRHQSAFIDQQGREAICFQITIYLYLLLALFMTIAVVGVFAIPLLLVFHLIATLAAIAITLTGKPFRYPANISIIDRDFAVTDDAQKG